MNWKLTSGRPVWLQLKEHIAMGIVTGIYPPGSRLPSVRELAMQAGVNPNTMQRALTELERDGYAQSMGTMGRVVTQDREKVDALRKTMARDIVEAYLEGMRQIGYTNQEAIKLLEGWSNE